MKQQKLTILVHNNARCAVFNRQKFLYGSSRNVADYDTEMAIDNCGINRKFPVIGVNIQRQSCVCDRDSTLYFGFKTTPSVTKLETI